MCRRAAYAYKTLGIARERDGATKEKHKGIVLFS